MVGGIRQIVYGMTLPSYSLCTSIAWRSISPGSDWRHELMRRVVLTLTGLGCVLAALVFCYKPVILDGEQFAYRDAGCYYYPLHLQVQREWEAGRWPLWDPSQNGGMPLLGNPTAAVLYPGKLVFALFPYALAARLYVIVHTVLAFIGMLALGRTWRLSWTGSMIAGLSYAFGAPVLFQYCNVIYLVARPGCPSVCAEPSDS